MAATRPLIRPVLLCGGMGSRLWPLSRELYPKQFLPLSSDRSMLQETAARVSDSQRFAAPVVVCNQEHRFLVAEQLRRDGVHPAAILLEPEARNTAAACAVAAVEALKADPDALMLVLPADHVVGDPVAFLDAVDVAVPAAASGHLVTFGIAPMAPETGYGYIRRGAPLPDAPGAFILQEFVEKPSRAVAEGYLEGGLHVWNSGMFLFPAALFLRELERYAPDILTGARDAMERGTADLEFVRLDRTAFATCPALSVDVAVMERTDRAVVVPCEIGWTDVGAWSALWDIGAKDEAGNVLRGDAVTEDAHGCYIRSDGMLTAVVGLDNAVVVVTGDAVLVSHKDKVQRVKELVGRLRKDGRAEILAHREVHRPWGAFQSIHTGDRFQVKCLTVAPGAKLSLQKHYHRAEHWVVVQGTARVTRDEEQVLVFENQSIYLPMGTVHRLENPGKVPLRVIEVQSGSYLGEDDIVRIEDTYGRS